jgi:predicted Zn-dependent protease
MQSFGRHTVIGSWSNKYNNGETPVRRLLTEDQSAFVRGSLARTAAHEFGHVLGLTHSCNNCLMYSSGYAIEDLQADITRIEATRRIQGVGAF